MLDYYWNHVCFDTRGSSGPTVIMLHGTLIMWELKRLKQPWMHAVFYKNIKKSYICILYSWLQSHQSSYYLYIEDDKWFSF